jgi:hypothetical protein
MYAHMNNKRKKKEKNGGDEPIQDTIYTYIKVSQLNCLYRYLKQKNKNKTWSLPIFLHLCGALYFISGRFWIIHYQTHTLSLLC